MEALVRPIKLYLCSAVGGLTDFTADKHTIDRCECQRLFVISPDFSVFQNILFPGLNTKYVLNTFLVDEKTKGSYISYNG